MSDNSQFYEITAKTKCAIIEAIGLLKTTKTLYADADESRWITVEIAELEAELAKIKAKELAYAAGQIKITPPSEDDIKIVEEKAKELDGMIAEAQASKAIFNTVTEVIETWNKTQAR